MQTNYYYRNNLLQNSRVGKKVYMSFHKYICHSTYFLIEKEYKRKWFGHSHSKIYAMQWIQKIKWFKNF